eukprot:g60220.t1
MCDFHSAHSKNFIEVVNPIHSVRFKCIQFALTDYLRRSCPNNLLLISLSIGLSDAKHPQSSLLSTLFGLFFSCSLIYCHDSLSSLSIFLFLLDSSPAQFEVSSMVLDCSVDDTSSWLPGSWEVQRSRLFHNLIRTTQRPPGYVAHNISRDPGLVDCTMIQVVGSLDLGKVHIVVYMNLTLEN